jgi:hypothetical protein
MPRDVIRRRYSIRNGVGIHCVGVRNDVSNYFGPVARRPP